MRRSKILLGIVALVPAVLLVTSHSTLRAANGDECRIKPDGSAPPGLHWYYRVDRTNNRHCWYLHAQGMQVHSPVNSTSRDRDVQNDTTAEEVPQPPLVAQTPQGIDERSDALAGRSPEFTSRWVDLPRSVDLDAHEPVKASNGYAAEPGTKREELSPAWPKVSAMNGEVQQSAPAGINFGSISLVGAAVLALLMISEALVRLVRTSSWTLLHRGGRAGSRHREEDFEWVVEPSRQRANPRMTTTIEPTSGAPTGPGELRHLLQRAGTGLKPPQSFAPSCSMRHHDHDGIARAESALQRLKSRSFSGMTWAPL